jgi:hypothetical protein
VSRKKIKSSVKNPAVCTVLLSMVV